MTMNPSQIEKIKKSKSRKQMNYLNIKTAGALIVFMIYATSFLRADWNVLKDDEGQTVEVAIDFTIKKKTTNPDESIFLVLSATNNGGEVGFSALISKPSDSVIHMQGKKEPAPIMRSEITLASTGAPTKALEKCLLLLLNAESYGDESLRVVGIFSAMSQRPNVSFLVPTVLHATDHGLTFDDKGKRVLGQCFAITFIMDIPMNRITAYFSTPAGFGGISTATRVRMKKSSN